MPFLSQKAVSAVAGGTGGYLNPSKIQSGSSVRFALLSDQPLEFYECWGEAEDGSVKPFRFSEDPSAEDIRTEMGDDYTRRQNSDGTAPEPAKFAIAAPVYNYEASAVQIMQVTQKTIIRELDGISQMEDYSNLMEHDFVLGKEGSGYKTEYSLRPVPRKKGSDKDIGGTWAEAQDKGFDINRLMTGENPFKAD